MNMTTSRFIATLLVWIALLFVSMPTTHAENAYKCVDELGATYFSDKQCKGSQEQMVIGIKPAPPASPEERANLEARQERYQRMRDAQAEDRQERHDKSADELARKKAKQQEICEAEKDCCGSCKRKSVRVTTVVSFMRERKKMKQAIPCTTLSRRKRRKSAA